MSNPIDIFVGTGNIDQASQLQHELFPDQNPTLSSDSISRIALANAQATAGKNISNSAGNILEDYEVQLKQSKATAEIEQSSELFKRNAEIRARTNALLSGTALQSEHFELSNAVAVNSSRPNPEALYAEGFENLGDLSLLSGDETQSELYDQSLRNFSIYESELNDHILDSVWVEELEKAGLLDKRGFYGLTDLAQGFVPFIDSTSRGGNLQDESDIGIIGDVFSGGVQREEVLRYGNLSLEQKIEVIPELIGQIQDNTTDLGYYNGTRALEIASAFREGMTPQDSDVITLMNIFDNTPTLYTGAKLSAKAGIKGSAMLRHRGAVKESAELLAKAMQDHRLQRKSDTGIEQLEIQEEVIPQSLNPSKANDPTISNGQQAVEALERSEAILSRLNTRAIQRLTGDELQKAADSVIKNVETLFKGKRKLEDIRVVNKTEGTLIDTPVVTGVIGKPGGGGYARASSVTQFLQNQGLKFNTTQRAVLDKADDTFEYAFNRAADTQEVNGKFFFNLDAKALRSLTESGSEVHLFRTPTGNTIAFKASDFSNPVDGLSTLGISSKNLEVTTIRPNDGTVRPFKSLEGDERPVTLTPEESVKADDLRVEKDAAVSKALRLEKSFEDAHAAGNTPSKILDTLRKDLFKAKEEAADLEAKYFTEFGPLKDVIQDPVTKQFYAQVEFPVIEKGYFTETATKTASVPSSDGFLDPRAALGSRQLSADELFGLSSLSISQRNSVMRALKNFIKPRFSKLNFRERKFISDIVKKGEQEQRWLSELEIKTDYYDKFNTKSRFPDKVLDAYNAYREVNDLEYTIFNSEVYSGLSSKGYTNVKIENSRLNLPESNAIVRQTIERRPEGRIYDAETGTHILKNDEFDVLKLNSEGYRLVEYQKPQTIDFKGDGTEVTLKFVLVKDTSLLQSPLKRVQLGYRAGGHRMYADNVKYFVKQASKGKQGDTGEEFFLSPKTWIGGKVPSELKPWVNRMNEAGSMAKLYRAGTLTEQQFKEGLGNVLEPEKGMPSVQEYFDMIDTGKLDPRFDLEIVFDREMPSQYANTPTPDSLDFVETTAGQVGYLETQGRMFYSGKGDRLRDAQGEALPILDPFEAQNRALLRATNIAGLHAYKVRAVEKWVETFKDVLDTPVSKNSNVMTIFGETGFRKGVDSKTIARARGERDSIKRTLNWTTGEDKAVNSLQRQVTEFMDDLTGGNQYSRMVTNWVTDSNFISSLRGAAFDMKLGMLNVAQFPMQISTMFAAISLDTVGGAKAMAALPALRVYSTGVKNTDTSFLEGLKRFDDSITFGQKDTDDFLAMAKELRDGGFLDINGSHQLANSLGPQNAFNLTGGAISEVRSRGRFFFEESERWNRTIAFQLAWRQSRKKHPTLQGQDFLEKVYARADDMSLNMMENSSAAWQKGVLSVPTQFFSYPIRMAEAMLGKQLSRQERIRLFTGQAVLYGSAGVPLASFLSEMVQGSNADATSFDETASPLTYIDRGLVDTLIMAVTGNDVRYSERAGTGSFWTDVVRDITGASKYGDTSTFDTFAGATGSIFGDTSADLVNSLKYFVKETSNEQFDFTLTRAELVKTFRNISTVNNLMKFHAIQTAGQLQSKRGTILVDDLDFGDAVASLLGVPIQETAELSAYFANEKNRKNAVDEAVRQLRIYRGRIQADPENVNEVIREMEVFKSLMIPDFLRKDVERELGNYPIDSVLDSISKRVTRRQDEQDLQDKIQENLEEGQE